MSFLKLDNIGKIYVSSGNVNVGIRNVNLDFELGQFVAITGKSGSGKSTLLNIISGMDTYEEGELYINGNPTSHYIQQDWEEYREKYISFIFQDYNIIDSFTVLENVELALMNIDNLVERRKKALKLIERVGLTKFKNQKGSHLSGGQKQRTVIARALAKDSPIILADEPTGNLDSSTSKEIINLLKEVSKDKLVIVVTHNYDDFEDVANRHVRIFDGSIENDSITKSYKKIEYKNEEKDNSLKNKAQKKCKDGFMLGWAIFKSKPKLTFLLCLILCIASFSMLSTISGVVLEKDLFKQPMMFEKVDGRVIVAKQEGVINKTDLENLSSKYNATYERYDFLLDTDYKYDYYFVDDLFGGSYDYNFKFAKNKKYHGKLHGKYPENDDEVLLYVPISHKTINGKEITEENKYFNIYGCYYKVTGIIYFANTNTHTPEVLLTKKGYDLVQTLAINFNKNYYKVNGHITYNEIDSEIEYNYNYQKENILPNYLLKGDEFFVYNTSRLTNNPIDANKCNVSYKYTGYITINYNGVLEQFAISSENYKNIYPNIDFSSAQDDKFKSYRITNSQTKYNDEVVNTIYISPEKYLSLVSKHIDDNYNQASIYVKNNRTAKKVATDIFSNGEFRAVASGEKYNDSGEFEAIIQVVGGIFVFIGFVIKIIFLSFLVYICSKKIIDAFKADIGIMRSMGIKVKTIHMGMYFRMIFSIIPGFIISVAFYCAIERIPLVNYYLGYVYWWEYLILLIALLFIVIRVTKKQIKNIFNVSVKNSLRGGN